MAATRSSTARYQLSRVGSQASSRRCPPGSLSRSNTTTRWPRAPRRCRDTEPGRAGPDHDDPLGEVHASQRSCAPPVFPSGRRVHDACDLDTAECAADADVRPDTPGRLGGSPLSCFPDEVGVGEMRPRHRDHVGVAGGDCPCGHAQIDDAPGDEDRGSVAHHALCARCGCEGVVLRHTHRGDRHVPGVRRSDREIEEIEDRCIREYCELGQRLVDRDARGADAFVVGECEADRVVLPDLGADGSADLQREAAACFDTAAVRVVADVVERAEKLADEPTVRTVHLDAMNAACLACCGRSARSRSRADRSPRRPAARASPRQATARATVRVRGPSDRAPRCSSPFRPPPRAARRAGSDGPPGRR